jgi:type I restriction enzyme, S subunit
MSFNEWETYKLEQVADVIGGGTPSTSNQDYWGNEISWLTPRDLSNHLSKYISKGERSITKLGLQNSSARLLPEGAVLLTSRAPIGYLAIATSPVTTNQGFKSFVVKENLLSNEFLFYLLKHNVELLQQLGTGTTFAEISATTLKGLEFSFPTLEVQNKIAHILSTIDDKIENNLATNQTLEEIARTLFKEWFVNFNYPNADGNLKHSEFGEIPESWSINGIGEICYVQNGYAFKSKDFQEQGEVGIIKIKNISGNVVNIKNTDFVDATVVSSLDKKFKIESGSLLIAMTGAEVGKIGLVPLTEKNLWLNQRVGMFQEKIAYGNLFMYLLLSTDTYQTAIQNSALGSAQPNISASAIESIRAIIPPAELIEAFGKTVKPMFEKILDNLAENETLKTTRDCLLPKLMSGEIEVNG